MIDPVAEIASGDDRHKAGVLLQNLVDARRRNQESWPSLVPAFPFSPPAAAASQSLPVPYWLRQCTAARLHNWQTLRVAYLLHFPTTILRPGLS